MHFILKRNILSDIFISLFHVQDISSTDLQTQFLTDSTMFTTSPICCWWVYLLSIIIKSDCLSIIYYLYSMYPLIIPSSWWPAVPGWQSTSWPDPPRPLGSPPPSSPLPPSSAASPSTTSLSRYLLYIYVYTIST